VDLHRAESLLLRHAPKANQVLKSGLGVHILPCLNESEKQCLKIAFSIPKTGNIQSVTKVHERYRALDYDLPNDVRTRNGAKILQQNHVNDNKHLDVLTKKGNGKDEKNAFLEIANVEKRNAHAFFFIKKKLKFFFPFEIKKIVCPVFKKTLFCVVLLVLSTNKKWQVIVNPTKITKLTQQLSPLQQQNVCAQEA
jgi:hypothetical protein